MTLFRQHARTEGASTLVWAIVLGLAGFATTYMWDIMRASGALEEMEKALNNVQGIVRGLVGAGGLSLTSIDAWIQGYALGSWISLPYVIFTALFVVGMITREMDRRTIEFVLSLPVTRARMLISRWLALAGSLTLLHLAQLIGVLTAVAVLGQEGHPGRYAVAEVNSLLLYLFLGSLMLLVSLFVDDYGLGTGVTLGVGLGLNFFHMGTSEATGALKSLREVLPFSLYDAQSIVMNGTVPWGPMITLGGGTLLLLALSVWVFQQKQIAV